MDRPIDSHIQVAETILKRTEKVQADCSPFISEAALKVVTCELLLAIAKSLHKITEKLEGLTNA